MNNILKSDNQNKSTSPQDITSHIDPNLKVEYVANKENPEDLDISWLRWKCLNCGYVYEGVAQLKKCPKCGNENPDLFTDVD